MASRPHTLLSPNPGVVAATIPAHRPGTSKDRNLRAWRVVRWKKRHAQTSATLVSAVVAARSSAATVRRSQRDAEERLASIGRCADWVGYAGRLITVNLTVVGIHVAVLRWIFLPIGG
jgi:hypothetical protein